MMLGNNALFLWSNIFADSEELRVMFDGPSDHYCMGVE